MRVWLLVLLGIATSVMGRCPSSEQLPWKYNSRKFMCARVYEHSNHIENWSCGGSSLNIYNGESTGVVPLGWNDKVSSLVVRPGCYLELYEDGPFRGSSKRFTGRVTDLRDVGWNDLASAWSCTCKFTNAALYCSPLEEEITRHTCHNSNPGSMDCKYTLTKGLQIGNSVTFGRSVSHTVEVSMEAAFMEIFTVGLSASTTTTYNWSQTRSSTFSRMESIEVNCQVPAGRTVHLKQVIGKCGDTTVYTEHYRCD